MWFCALGRDALVRVSDLVTFASLGVAEFESCASQKCCVMMQITLTWSGVFHAINSKFKWTRSMITCIIPFFRSLKKKKKKKLYGFVNIYIYIYLFIGNENRVKFRFEK